MALVADGAEATLDNVFGSMKNEFSNVDGFTLDSTTTTGGRAFSLVGDKDTYCFGYTDVDRVWYAAGWDLETLTTDNNGGNLTWDTNEFFRNATDESHKGSQKCIYYLGATSDFAWCMFYPIENPDNTNSYQDPISFGIANLNKLWDWYPEFECLQHPLMAGGSGTQWRYNNERAWSPLRSTGGAANSPNGDSTVSSYQTASLTSANSWVGSEKNIVISNNITGMNDGTVLGTFEGWGYDHQYNQSNQTVPSGTKISTSTGESFIYLDPVKDNDLGPNFFQY